MSEVVNLRRRRKAKAREDAAREAERNRAAHGLPKAARQKAQMEKAANIRFLDGHKRDKSGNADLPDKTDG